MAEQKQTGSETPPEADPIDVPRSKSTGKLVVFAVTVCASLALIYGILQVGGKNGAGSGSTKLASACTGAATAAARIAPLAVDKLAALAVHKAPKPATNISFSDPDGKPVSLKDFHGKTVLLNIWATWCVPCRAEMPALDRLQRELGSNTFEVVAVNIDTARLERRKPFLDSVGVKDLKFYADPQAESFQILKRAGKVIGLPTTFLIDAKGCELGRMAGPAEWDSSQAKKLIEASWAK